MTFTLKHETIGNYYLEMTIEKFTDIVAVRAYESHGGEYGFPFSENYYSDTQKATRQYNALKRKLK